MLRVFEVRTDNGTEWILSDDTNTIDALITANGWQLIADHDPMEVLNHHYQGLAYLNTGP